MGRAVSSARRLLLLGAPAPIGRPGDAAIRARELLQRGRQLDHDLLVCGDPLWTCAFRH